MAHCDVKFIDQHLEQFRGHVENRAKKYSALRDKITAVDGSLEKFADAYKTTYGWTREEGGWRFREWLPGAVNCHLIGDFNGWHHRSHRLTPEEYGRWSIFLADNEDGTWAIQHRCKYRILVTGRNHSGDVDIDRVPAYATLVWQNPTTLMFDAVFWQPSEEEKYEFKFERPQAPPALKIYEAHVGMSDIDPRVHTYKEFKDVVLPRIVKLGYNAIQLMAIQEHAHYGSFGYHVTSFFAPSSRQGTPEELKELTDAAHSMGLIVLMDIVHSHMSSNAIDGIAQLDGTDYCYKHAGPKGHHAQWDSSIFDYSKWEVVKFLLSNVKYWMNEFGFDGFRYDGVTSMLYEHHGVGMGFSGGYHEYFNDSVDLDAHVYLMLANDLIHSLHPASAVSVAEDVSGMPLLCRPVKEGGFGFDYRLAMAMPDLWIKMLKELKDDDWNMGHIVHTLTNRRFGEKCIAYCESHDQSIVGDKTIAMWLMDAELYHGMSKEGCGGNHLIIDRGIALHKMIRTVTMALGGEGYLCFMGSEFGHPEWVDFPREGNGWSYLHCRRRWDLADNPTLRYYDLQHWDECMHFLEWRFGLLASPHEYVVKKDEGDKVIAFERGGCLFVFNFHPCKSFEGYGIETRCSSPMRVIMDSDQLCYGGQERISHSTQVMPHKVGDGIAGYPDSYRVQLYVPSRTCQILAPEEEIAGQPIKVDLSAVMKSVGASSLTVKYKAGHQHPDTPFEGEMTTDEKGRITFPGHLESAEFHIYNGEEIAIFPTGRFNQTFRIYLPGKYEISEKGTLTFSSKVRDIWNHFTFSGRRMSNPVQPPLSTPVSPKVEEAKVAEEVKEGEEDVKEEGDEKPTEVGLEGEKTGITPTKLERPVYVGQERLAASKLTTLEQEEKKLAEDVDLTADQYVA